MIFKISDVLSPEELQQITFSLVQAPFVDGKLTAGWHAKLVKHNQQLAEPAVISDLREIVEAALHRNALFQVAVRPKLIHSLLFSRYDVGMSYGTHTDDAFMGGTAFWRSDVSFTLFLTAPSDYQGGELVIEGADDERAYKLAAGSMIVYPSTTLHRVDPVTHGTRFVVAGWVQSLIRDTSQREILFDLETVRRSLFANNGKTSEFDLLSKSIANLLRTWSD
jgi:PKHD-type hydroxylase